MLFLPRSGTTRQDTGYAYDLAGNITALTERAPHSGVAGADELARGFTYDALYRLLTATGREKQPTAARPWQASTRSDGPQSTTAYTQRYSYDKLGNIQLLRHQAANSADSFTRSFDYGPGTTNYLQSVQLGADQVTYLYDAAGNVTQENGSRHFQWDAADQLRQFATWTGPGTAPTLLAYYLYAGGQRVKKLTQTGGNTWQVTVYAEGGFEHRYEVSQGTRSGEQTQLAVLDGQHRLFQRRSGDALGDQRPAKLYALDDHLGSAAALTDATGGLVSREEYYPFGETSFGSSPKQRYRFCGKELDEESGLYYYGMRYYAAWLCRFVSVDPLAAKYAFYTPYQYAGNKPINATDLDGAEEKPVVDSGGQGSPANLGRPSQATRQDAIPHAPVPRTVHVHNVSLAQKLASYQVQSQHDAVMGPAEPRADSYQARQNAAAITHSQAAIQASFQPHDNAMQLGVTVYGYLDLAITGVGLMRAAPGFLRSLATLGKAETNAAGALVRVPGPAAAEGFASWGGDVLNDFRAVEASLTSHPTVIPRGPSTYKFWTTATTFEGVPVFQRNDLFDPNQVSAWTRKGKIITGTNVERMAAGNAPLSPDGKPVNLHHLIQIDGAGLAEVSNKMHKEYSGILHINPNTTKSGIARGSFDLYRSRYWMARAQGFK